MSVRSIFFSVADRLVAAPLGRPILLIVLINLVTGEVMIGLPESAPELFMTPPKRL